MCVMKLNKRSYRITCKTMQRLQDPEVLSQLACNNLMNAVETSKSHKRDEKLAIQQEARLRSYDITY